MNELRLLEEIRNDFVSKFDNDPQVKRICNVMINEFKARKKALTLTDVVGRSEQLKPKEQICYKSNEPCKYDCSGLCKESCQALIAYN